MSRGVVTKAPVVELRIHEMTRGRSSLLSKQLSRHILNPKSSFHRWLHSFDGS